MGSTLTGKKAVILGLANDRSIAWGIAKRLKEEGADLAFNFLGEALEKRVRPLAESLGSTFIEQCDVSKDEEIESFFGKLQKTWGTCDILIHSVAFANKDDLQGRFVETPRAGFKLALDVSAYSLIATSRAVLPLMPKGGTILTLTYYGSEKVIPGYNVMGVAKAALEASVRYLAHDLGPNGVRVHAISAGPIKTLAAAGAIPNFRDFLTTVEERSPMRANVTPEDVGAMAAFLCTEEARHVTGNITYVDSGYHILGV